MSSDQKNGAAERKAEDITLNGSLRRSISQHDSVPQNRVFSEMSRHVLNGTAVESEYRAGYTTITVRSRFGGTCAFSDLMREIALRRLKSQETQQ